jgi:peptidoglycan hydrolase-like protein with peptidoglycan-binding domain
MSAPSSVRRGRAWRRAGVVVGVLAVAGAAAAATVGFGGADAATPQGSTLPPATAQVTKQTLVDAQKESGTLGYGRETSVTNRLGGTVTALTDIGTTVKRGETLFRVDNTPVVALYGTLPPYRALSPGTEGADVKQFEQELRSLGYTGFTVDAKYDPNTATAVKKWQKKLGLTQTGVVELGRVLYAPGEVRVATQKVAAGDAAQPGQAVLTTTGTARVVTVTLEVRDQRLAKKDAAVMVNTPDGKQVGGTITKVATIIDTSGKAPATKIEVTIALASAVEGFTDAAVDVNFTAAERKDVLTVPVAALLALAEGGYGVQVVDGGTTKTVAVQTGLFSGGRVEVSGDGLTEGMTVGMPT